MNDGVMPDEEMTTFHLTFHLLDWSYRLEKHDEKKFVPYKYMSVFVCRYETFYFTE